MKLGDITWKNIKAFVEGNLKMFGDRINVVDPHIREQVEYRAYICKDTCKEKCEVCGCSVPGKWYVKKSCNDGDKFPDLMGEKEWKKFKEDNDIKI